MDLTAAEARVLGCLIERQVTEPDEYALSLDELRFACNQTSGRHPVVAFDDRAVEDTLLSLKAKGLARFVAAGRTTGPVHYRHRADERWRLSRPELAVLAVLLLRGPQTLREVRAALADSPIPVDQPFDVEAVLDALAGRTPTPLARRVGGSTAPGTEQRWSEALTVGGRRGVPIVPGLPGPSDPTDDRTVSGDVGGVGIGVGGGGPVAPEPLPWSPPAPSGPAARPSPTLSDLADRLTNIERRLAGIEAAIGALRAATTANAPNPASAPAHPPTRAHR